MTGAEQVDESVVDEKWLASLREHEGCACIDRAPNGACAIWVQRYVDHIHELLAAILPPPRGRG